MLVQVVIFLLLNMYLDLAWCLQPIVTSETVTEASLSLLLSKRNTFFEQLDYFLDNFSEVEEVGKHGNQLACRVSIFGLIY
jgi:cohesin complex subunit SA-1/2